MNVAFLDVCMAGRAQTLCVEREQQARFVKRMAARSGRHALIVGSRQMAHIGGSATATWESQSSEIQHDTLLTESSRVGLLPHRRRGPRRALWN